jgi:hypothetical protein
VRNTFIDLDVPRGESLERLRTWPDEKPTGFISLNSDDESEEAWVPPNAASLSSGDGSLDAPPADSLYRTVTLDSYEASPAWMWADQRNWCSGAEKSIDQEVVDPNHQEEAQPQQAVMPSGGVHPMGVMAWPGMMMLPVNMLSERYDMAYSQPLPMPMPLTSMPVGFELVPVDPYGRWPNASMLAPKQEAGLVGASAPSQMDIATAGATGAGSARATGTTASDEPAKITETTSTAMETTSTAIAPAPAQNQLLRSSSVNSGIDRVHWTVDARKLKTNDKGAVSPTFHISLCGQDIPFKMHIHAKAVSGGKGGSGFRKSKGHGSIELKCEGSFGDGADARATYRLSIGSGNSKDLAKQQNFRGPVSHNFANGAVSGLKKGEEDWDFAAAVDEASLVFVVHLEFS